MARSSRRPSRSAGRPERSPGVKLSTSLPGCSTPGRGVLLLRRRAPRRRLSRRRRARRGAAERGARAPRCGNLPRSAHQPPSAQQPVVLFVFPRASRRFARSGTAFLPTSSSSSSSTTTLRTTWRRPFTVAPSLRAAERPHGLLSPSLPSLNLTQKHTAQLPALRAAYMWTFSRLAPAPSPTLLAIVPVRETPPLPALGRLADGLTAARPALG